MTSGGTVDPSTKRVDVFIEWVFQGDTTQLQVSKYLTRTNNFVIRQTDWSGGENGTDPVSATSTTNTFFTVSPTIDFDGEVGSLKLKFD